MSQSARNQANQGRQPPRPTRLSGIILIGVALLVMILTTGCGGRATPVVESAPAAPTATAEPTIAPERLELGRTLLIDQGCVGCHTIAIFPEAQGQIGPSLSHIATEALSIIASQEYTSSGGTATSAREYLRESILKPSQFLAPACPTGACPDYVMPRDFKTRLKPDELDVLLDVLMTLK